MKKCAKCGEFKNLFDFYKEKKYKDGHTYTCKFCILKYAKSEHVLAKKRILSKKYRENNPEKVKAHYKKYSEINKESLKQKRKEYALKNKDKIKIRQKEYRSTEKYREINKIKCREFKKNFPEKKKKCDRNYFLNNKAKCSAIGARYRALKKNATPKWLTKEHNEEIEKFYEISHRLTKESGILHNVDHIIPIQGETVTGLHVPWNLQVITAKENQIKKNKLLPEFLHNEH